jgi:hypothetical protein
LADSEAPAGLGDTARDGDRLLVGFAKIVSDGADHAFVIDV